MKNDIVVCNEFGRKIAYCNVNGRIYRREIYNLNDLLRKLGLNNYEEGIKIGIISEVGENNIKLQEYRSLLLHQQLEGNFINNLTNPIDDDVICQELFEQFIHKLFYSPRNIRLKSDKKFDYKSPKNILLTEAKIFSILLNNFDYLKDSPKVLELSHQGMKQLMLHANDLDYLQKILKLFVDFNQRKEPVTFNKRRDDAITAEKYGSMYPELFSFSEEDMLKLYEFYDGLIDLQSEHIGPQNNHSDYEARLYFNIHDEEVMSQFLLNYISQCIKQNIPYNMKGLRATSEVGICDTTVFYTHFHDLKLHIEIIEKILLEHPEWRKSFEQPVYPASRFGTGFYGVTHAGGYDGATLAETYNDYWENSFRLAFYCMLAKVLIEEKLIKPTDDCWKLFNMLYEFKDLNIDSNLSAVKRITTNDNKIILTSATTNLLKKYINPQIEQKILALGHELFRDYVYKIHAFCQHLEPGTRMNLSVSNEMNEFFSKVMASSFKETPLVSKVETISIAEEKLFLEKCHVIVEAAQHSNLYPSGLRITIINFAKKIENEILNKTPEEFSKAYISLKRDVDYMFDKIKENKVRNDLGKVNLSDSSESLKKSIRYLTTEIRKRYHSASEEGRYSELIPVLHRCVLDFSSILSSNVNNDLEIILKYIISCHDNYVSAFNAGSLETGYFLSQLRVAIIKLEKSINKVSDYTPKKY